MVSLEDLTPEHFHVVAEWMSRASINRWLTAEWRDRVVTETTIGIAIRNKRNRFFLVRGEGRLCGVVALAELEVADQTSMVWYFLGDPAMSGKGIISEAVRQLAEKSFRELGLSSLYAWAMEDNIASLRVLRKAGFREAGHIRRAARSHGRLVDRVYFDIVADQFESS